MARILIGNIKGPQGERGPQGIQGPVGPVGPQGPLPPLINNGLTTEAGKAALDAAYGKTITDRLTELNSDFISYVNKLQVLNNLATVVFGYDGNSTTFVDWNITTEKILRIAFDNSTIRQLWTIDSGQTWETIWTK